MEVFSSSINQKNLIKIINESSVKSFTNDIPYCVLYSNK
jgi:hypothetical protein